MSQFYEVDSRHVSLRELWWWHKSPLVIIPFLLKWFRTRTPCSSDDPNTDSTLPFVVDQFPADIVVDFVPLANEFARLGFIYPVYHIIHDPGSQVAIYWATFRHPSGQYFARIHQRYWHRAAKPNRGIFPIFFTRFTDGTFQASSAGKPDMAAPATIEMLRMPYVSTTALWQKHIERTAQLEHAKTIAPVNSKDELIAVTEQFHLLVRDFHLARGVFQLRTTEQETAAANDAARLAQWKADGVEHADVLVELARIQKEQPKQHSSIWILLITILLFIFIGATRWKWDYVLWLIPVLLIHESGHWVAMRIFHYRNLRMFFIPLFGAAVMGQHWNVAGWKKALVSLAGPVPGIGLGVILGVTGLLTHVQWLDRVSLILLAINGFNLLPVLPLDGGHLFLNVLFCRHRILVIIFRVLTVIILAAMGLMGVSRVLFFLAIVMALSLPSAIRLAGVTDELRKKNLPPPLPGQDLIPIPTAQIIINSLKTGASKTLSNKILAAQVVNVYESLNARPPGFLATAGLLLIQGGSFLLAVLFGILIVVGRSGGLWDVFSAALHQPHYSVSSETIHMTQTDEAKTNPPVFRDVIVANFTTGQKAGEVFTNYCGQISGNEQMTLFGNSVLLTLPATNDAARLDWYGRFDAQTTNLFVASTNDELSAAISCLAPSARAATNLTHELQIYFGCANGLHLMPPWSPAARGAAYKAARHAREQWQRAEKAQGEAWTNSAPFARQIIAAEQRGDVAEQKHLEIQRDQAVKEAQAKIRETLLNDPADPIPTDLLDLQARLAALSWTNTVERTALRSKLAPLLGQVQFDGDHPAGTADDFGADVGSAMHRGPAVKIPGMFPQDPAVGLPALVNWLSDAGCTRIKYELTQVNRAAESDEE